MNRKICPLFNKKSDFLNECRKSNCMWWCEWADNCSMPLLASMYAYENGFKHRRNDDLYEKVEQLKLER